MHSLVKLSPNEAFINPYLLLDVLSLTQRDLREFKGPDAFKTGGHLCFWISRLKPFRAFLKNNAFYTNEVMALQIGLCIVRETEGPRAIPSNVMANMLYELRYEHYSAMSVTNQFQLLYCKAHHETENSH